MALAVVIGLRARRNRPSLSEAFNTAYGRGDPSIDQQPFASRRIQCRLG